MQSHFSTNITIYVIPAAKLKEGRANISIPLLQTAYELCFERHALSNYPYYKLQTVNAQWLSFSLSMLFTFLNHIGIYICIVPLGPVNNIKNYTRSYCKQQVGLPSDWPLNPQLRNARP